MRELKFRVWHKPTGVMHDYLKAKFGPKGVNITLSGKFKDVEDPTTLTVPNKDLEVMQFTGLRDKNGKEIYEGDLLEGHGYPGREMKALEVVWGYCGFGLKLGDIVVSLDPRTHNIEVVGNVWENPELINS